MNDKSQKTDIKVEHSNFFRSIRFLADIITMYIFILVFEDYIVKYIPFIVCSEYCIILAYFLRIVDSIFGYMLERSVSSKNRSFFSINNIIGIAVVLTTLAMVSVQFQKNFRDYNPMNFLLAITMINFYHRTAFIEQNGKKLFLLILIGGFAFLNTFNYLNYLDFLKNQYTLNCMNYLIAFLLVFASMATSYGYDAVYSKSYITNLCLILICIGFIGMIFNSRSNIFKVYSIVSEKRVIGGGYE